MLEKIRPSPRVSGWISEYCDLTPVLVFYSLSKLGAAQFKKYVAALHDLLDLA